MCLYRKEAGAEESSIGSTGGASICIGRHLGGKRGGGAGCRCAGGHTSLHRPHTFLYNGLGWAPGTVYELRLLPWALAQDVAGVQRQRRCEGGTQFLGPYTSHEPVPRPLRSRAAAKHPRAVCYPQDLHGRVQHPVSVVEGVEGTAAAALPAAVGMQEEGAEARVKMGDPLGAAGPGELFDLILEGLEKAKKMHKYFNHCTFHGCNVRSLW
ncbi:hypothetical protein B0H15DRAFT_799375 [Mycena belliarum]|uniref:Uncharacterized protein n=1 Tax=Mycena belliarum TaxID=1033014 RepID=A0AAD6XWJ6_9AGAR|nr:hypothetical protein B0H15DRAFT_799375 [Mycena belliae]